jgi:hypothetical protein
MYCCGGAEEYKGGGGDAAATVAHAAKGSDGEEEEAVDAAAALPTRWRPWERQVRIAAAENGACIAAAATGEATGRIKGRKRGCCVAERSGARGSAQRAFVRRRRGEEWIRPQRGCYVCARGGATFDNWRLTAEQGFTLIIARTDFQDRGIEHESALKFHPNRCLEVE